MIALALAAELLAVRGDWGAFRGGPPQNCYAIAAPVRAGGAGRAFVAIGSWPRQGLRGQLHVRLSAAKAPRARVTLSIGARRFELIAGDRDAWAPDARTDAAIVAAMRAGRSLSVEAQGASGRPFADVYALAGAATAIDAAALGCV
ncbi:MAG: hypothetical protein A4S12_04635 [Proteobacteria bacterium SG_bin5]|nr:MAG: hypothetical protein A4S12_04635 [Proteobacteria bacterium SG_bin5]